MILPGLGFRALDLEQTKSLKADIEKKTCFESFVRKNKESTYRSKVSSGYYSNPINVRK